MNVILNFSQTKELQDDDIIVCVKGKWTNVSRKEFLSKYEQQVKDCEMKVKNLEDLYNKLVEKINDRLEKYHNILQTITKEG